MQPSPLNDDKARKRPSGVERDRDDAIRYAHARLLDADASYEERVLAAAWLEVVFPGVLERHPLTDDAVSAISSATSDNSFFRSILRIAADDSRKVVAIIHETASPTSIIATDLIARLNRIIDGLTKAANIAGNDARSQPADVLYNGTPA